MRFRPNTYYIDSETVGFQGLITLIQWAYEDGDVHLHNLWDVPVRDTIELLEKFVEKGKTLCFFNANYDTFHMCKVYTMWKLLAERVGPDAVPKNIHVDVLAQAEKDARDGDCYKPDNVICLMLHSRKGKFQTLMSRHDVRVTKVPRQLGSKLAQELEKRIELDGILFAKRANPNAPKWGVYDRIKKGKEDEIDPDFVDVTLKFKPARGLKYLAEHCLGLDPEFHSFKDVYPIRPHKLAEIGYAPFALGISKPEVDWKVWDKQRKLKGYAWPALIHIDIKHWRDNEEARRYARDDVVYTRLLDEYFGFPEAGDNDSVLACMVASVRWHGFTIDATEIARLLAKSRQVLEASPVNINKPSKVKEYIREVMDETEATLIDKSTKKANLEKIRDEYIVDPDDCDPELGGELCIKCFGDGCIRCSEAGFLPAGPTPASKRADEILHIKAAAKEVELYTKLLQAGRFHAAFKVIGTLSSRMAGGEGLNAQGIKGSDEVRSSFPLKWGGMVLCGGDFDGFEVTLADAVFQDAKLRADLLAGKSIHTMMAVEIYPNKTEEEIKASKGYKDGGDVDMYTRGKQAVFATLYGGDANTINKKLSIPKKVAETAFDNFQNKYPGIKAARDKVAEDFAALEQHGEVGTGKITYKVPAEYVETFLGFRRYFPIENKIAKAIFDLAHDVPKAWRRLDFKVVRRDREQTPAGAVSSALYGAAFQIQAANIRAANNHLIQSPGAMITKDLQRQIWDIQPSGVNPWRVAPINIHDEVLSVTDPDYVDEVTDVTLRVVESYRDRVPLIGMDWVKSMENWAGKKGAKEAVISIGPHGIKEVFDDEEYVAPMGIEELEALDEVPDPCLDLSSLENMI